MAKLEHYFLTDVVTMKEDNVLVAHRRPDLHLFGLHTYNARWPLPTGWYLYCPGGGDTLQWHVCIAERILTETNEQPTQREIEARTIEMHESDLEMSTEVLNNEVDYLKYYNTG
ncbi:hypothetical protein ACJMK2_043603 [Sinanodonta woodiana]|uniref:Uncharacterized protein n=1 Tax=Sinanodonta woodiana TaxID=1069815 RepID=A0ABD3VXY5_SINWO